MGSLAEAIMLSSQLLLVVSLVCCQAGDPALHMDFFSQADTDRDSSRTDPGLVDFAVNIPVGVMAFLSAVLGGIMAPIITQGFRAIGSLPELFDIELPKITKKDDRYNYKYHYEDRSSAGHDLSSLFTFGLETLLKKVANTEDFL